MFLTTSAIAGLAVGCILAIIIIVIILIGLCMCIKHRLRQQSELSCCIILDIASLF